MSGGPEWGIRRGASRRYEIRMTRLAAAALVAVLASFPGGARAGELRGVVRFTGTPPATPALETTKEREVCGTAVPDDSLLVAKGKVQNVVVTVKGPPAAPAGKGTLDQRACRFFPHVQALPVGSTLEVVNGDPTLHNVHGSLGQATAFNLAMPSRDHRASRQLKKPGLVVVRCDVHAWMSAYVWVVDGPAAVTGEDGAYVVTGLPAGTFEVTAWHEKLGERKGTVTVPASGPATLDFTYGK